MLWLGGMLVVWGQLTYGELVAFYAYLLQLVLPIRRGGWLMTMAARASASAERIFEILDSPVTVADRPGATVAAAARRLASSFEDVSCSYYPGRPVLQHVTFRAEPGQTIALVGATGSGKTSIANLIPRFYDVDGGRVLVDGHDVRDVQLQSLRQQIGIVMQETLLFADTVRANIAYGRPGATDAEIRAAARAARADEFIERLPERLRHRRRRARRLALRRPEAAHRHRPRPADEPAHPDPGRVHLQRRRRHRAADPAGADRADAEPHHLRHRPPPLDRPRRRPDPGPRRLAGSLAARHPRAAPGDAAPLYRDTYALQLQSDDDASPARPGRSLIRARGP